MEIVNENDLELNRENGGNGQGNAPNGNAGGGGARWPTKMREWVKENSVGIVLLLLYLLLFLILFMLFMVYSKVDGLLQLHTAVFAGRKSG